MRVAIIPARGGSTRIPRKNIREFHGRPIIAYSIEAAQKSGLFETVYISSDDREIMSVAIDLGAKSILRCSELARDEVGTQEVMRAALDDLRIQRITPLSACCIYPCAPLLQPVSLIRAEAVLQASGADYVVPVGTWLRDPGQFYFGRTDAFLEGRPLLGSRTRMVDIPPETDIDINEEADWLLAEQRFAAIYLEARRADATTAV